MVGDFNFTKAQANSAVASRMPEGSRHVRSVSVSYKLARPSADVYSTRGLGKFGAQPYVTLDVVDYIDPALDAAISVTAAVAKYRAAARELLTQTWQAAIIKEFVSGPSRWTPLSPGYASWKMRQKFWSPVKTGGGKTVGRKVTRWGSGMADLTLKGKVRHNVFHKGRDAVGGHSRAANPSYRVDATKQFRSTPYIWLHEFGQGNIPMRDFIRRAQEAVAPALSGLAVTEGLVIHRALEGDGTVSPRRLRVTSVGPGAIAPGVAATPMMGKMETKGKFSFGWLTRWFSHPVWWVVPPSKVLLYMGIASDVRTILVRGIQVERMVVPFVSQWGIGMAGARAGIPLTKKQTRRKTRRRIWKGR